MMLPSGFFLQFLIIGALEMTRVPLLFLAMRSCDDDGIAKGARREIGEETLKELSCEVTS